MKGLFDKLSLNNLELNNRLVRSATWEALAYKDGSISDKTYEIYHELAKGGVGLIITGFTSVSSDDFFFDGMMRLSNDKLLSQYKKLVDVIHEENTPVIVQLALGAYFKKDVIVDVDEMSLDDIDNVVGLFTEAALRAESVGFDGVQIHAAHFFFLSRFISPGENHRTDSYGESTVNRSRIIVEIIENIRQVAPSLHLSMKINCDDFTFDGLREEESLEICKILADSGLDSIEVSGNGTSRTGIKAGVNEAYFLDFARRLADEVDIPVMLVGGLRSKDKMEDILKNTDIELLSLSRPLLCEPYLPDKFMNDKSSVSKCVSL